MAEATGPEDPFEDDRGCRLGRVAAETGGIGWGEDRKHRGEGRGDRKGRALGPKAPGTCPRRPDVCFAT